MQYQPPNNNGTFVAPQPVPQTVPVTPLAPAPAQPVGNPLLQNQQPIQRPQYDQGFQAPANAIQEGQPIQFTVKSTKTITRNTKFGEKTEILLLGDSNGAEVAMFSLGTTSALSYGVNNAPTKLAKFLTTIGVTPTTQRVDPTRLLGLTIQGPAHVKYKDGRQSVSIYDRELMPITDPNVAATNQTIVNNAGMS